MWGQSSSDGQGCADGVPSRRKRTEPSCFCSTEDRQISYFVLSLWVRPITRTVVAYENKAIENKAAKETGEGSVEGNGIGGR